MNMKKPEMKIMRFVNEDVIATSGATPPPLEISGFFDGKPNNLKAFVYGTEYNKGSDLKAALDNKFGGNYYTLILTFLNNGISSSAGFGIQGFDQSSDFDKGSDPFLVNANVKYEYSRSNNDTIFFTQKTQ